MTCPFWIRECEEISSTTYVASAVLISFIEKTWELKKYTNKEQQSKNQTVIVEGVVVEGVVVEGVVAEGVVAIEL